MDQNDALMENIAVCKKCKCKPILRKEAGGIYYLQCTGKSIALRGNVRPCDQWHPHEFIGATIKNVVESWNGANAVPLYRNIKRKNRIIN